MEVKGHLCCRPTGKNHTWGNGECSKPPEPAAAQSIAHGEGDFAAAVSLSAIIIKKRGWHHPRQPRGMYPVKKQILVGLSERVADR